MAMEIATSVKVLKSGAKAPVKTKDLYSIEHIYKYNDYTTPKGILPFAIIVDSTM